MALRTEWKRAVVIAALAACFAGGAVGASVGDMGFAGAAGPDSMRFTQEFGSWGPDLRGEARVDSLSGAAEIPPAIIAAADSIEVSDSGSAFLPAGLTDCNTNGTDDDEELSIVVVDHFLGPVAGMFVADADLQFRADDFEIPAPMTFNTVVFEGEDTFTPPAFRILIWSSVPDSAFPPPDDAGGATPRSAQPGVIVHEEPVPTGHVATTDSGADQYRYACTLASDVTLPAGRYWLEVQCTSMDFGVGWSWFYQADTGVGFRMRFRRVGAAPAWLPSGGQGAHRFQLALDNDLNDNGFPDACEDCNTNGVSDPAEIAGQVAVDCNRNGTPDACDVLMGTASDCNGNGAPDACEADCDTNGVPDDCDIAGPTAEDCDTNGVADVCDLTIYLTNALAHNNSSFTNQVGGGVVGQTADDFYVTEPMTLTGGWFVGTETLAGDPEGAFVWNGQVLIEVFADTGMGSPRESAIDSTIASASRFHLGGFNTNVDLFHYALDSIELDIPAGGTWWISMRPISDGGSGIARWTRGELGTVTGHEAYVRTDTVPTFSPSSTTISGSEPWGMVFHLRFRANDCNGNRVPDDCDIAGVTSEDLNGDGAADPCQDCNTNGVVDAADLAMATSDDCDANGVPDECQADCNTNGVADACDASGTTSQDCNCDAVPDECQFDCNTNGIEDSCDIGSVAAADCNTDGIPDACGAGGQTSLFLLNVPGARVSADGLTWTGGVIGLHPSDPTPAGGTGTFNVRAADFDLETAAQVNVVTWVGAFESGSAGDGAGDSFAIAFRDHGVLVNEPGSLLASNPVSSASGSLTRVLLGTLGGNDLFQYVATVPTVDLASGRGWVEIYYTGNAPGTWLWASGEGSLGSPDAFAAAIPETWAASGVAAGRHHLFALHHADSDCNADVIPDECQVTGGSDCNSNGVPDECETDCDTNSIPDACETDCDTNGVGDHCEIGAGTSADANSNGLPDPCEDCNHNGSPDDLDIRSDASPDCNTNGVPDACDVGFDVILESGVIAPFDFENPAVLEIAPAPTAIRDIVVDLAYICDCGLSFETFDIDLNGMVVGTAGNFSTTDCTPGVEQIVISAADWNAAKQLGGGAITVTATATDSVDAISCSQAALELTFLIERDGEDCNDNGLVDACEVDSGAADDENGNGVPDACEAFTCDCPGDLTGDGVIDGDDIPCFVACRLGGATAACGACDCADALSIPAFLGILLDGPNVCP